jgi:carboxylesterase type B
MSGLLLSFARRGKPQSPRVPEWPAFDPLHPLVLKLGEQIGLSEWPHYDSLQLLASPGSSDPRTAADGRPRD